MSDRGHQNIVYTGFDWDQHLNTLEEELVYTDDPSDIEVLIETIKDQLPEGCAGDDENMFGGFPTYSVNLTDDQTNLLTEILKGAQ